MDITIQMVNRLPRTNAVLTFILEYVTIYRQSGYTSSPEFRLRGAVKDKGGNRGKFLPARSGTGSPVLCNNVSQNFPKVSHNHRRVTVLSLRP